MHLCKIRYREISGVHTENKEESNMIRRVIQIEEDKCNGCGACAKACHEGAIGMVNGKAKLMHPCKFVAELWIFATAIYPQIL